MKTIGFAVLTMTGLLACGGGGDDMMGHGPDPDPKPCARAMCGTASFRRAVPTRDLMRIDFKGKKASARARQVAGALAAESPAQAYLADHIADVNGSIEGFFKALEEISAMPPTVDKDAEQQWRMTYGTYEHALTMTRKDASSYALRYAIGAPGFDAAMAKAVIEGTVAVGADGAPIPTLTVDFDAATKAQPSIAMRGTLTIAAKRDADTFELQYDFEKFADGDEPIHDDLTTYWEHGADDGGLQYRIKAGPMEMVTYARWDAKGGRADGHARVQDSTLGDVEVLAVNCWNQAGGERFDGRLLIDEGKLFGGFEGNETECAFGPVADHPNPSKDFAALPKANSWAGLKIQACPTGDTYCSDPKVDDLAGRR